MQAVFLTHPIKHPIQGFLFHWEWETVYSSKDGSRSRLPTLVERKTRYAIMPRMPNQSAARFRDVFRSITFDNGSEFSDVSGMEGSCQGPHAVFRPPLLLLRAEGQREPQRHHPQVPPQRYRLRPGGGQDRPGNPALDERLPQKDPRRFHTPGEVQAGVRSHTIKMQYHGGWLMSSKHQDQVSGHSSLQRES